jgi:hypothetical protein
VPALTPALFGSTASRSGMTHRLASFTAPAPSEVGRHSPPRRPGG